MNEALKKMLMIEQRNTYKDSLSEFVKAAWTSIDPATMRWNWHHDAICEHIEALYKGQIHRLAVALPPRHTKSTIISVAAPAWGWTWKPSMRYLCASYVIGLSLRDAQKCRELMDSPWYQSLFGNSFQWASDQNAKARYENKQDGFRIATSVGGAATGEGGDIISIDDPHNIQQAESDAVRKDTLAWFDNTMTSRLNDQATGGIVVIGQRVHSHDLIGHILGQGGWEYLMLPAEYDEKRRASTSIGWTDPRTIPGEPLWDVKFPKVVLDNLKIVLQINYYAQYQQQPVTEAGTIIKAVTMLSYKDEGETYVLHMPQGDKRVLKFLCRSVISTDLALTASQQADMTVYLSWAICPDGEALLLEIISGRWEAPEAEDILDTLYRRVKRLWCVIVEDNAFQKSLVQRLRRKGCPVRPKTSTSDKVARAQNISVYFNLGYFFFDSNISGFAEYKTQLLGFPRADGDDMVDATSIMHLLYEQGEPQMTAIELSESREQGVIEEIAQYNKELAEFLQGSLFGE